MNDAGPNLSPTGRDIAGAWLVCALTAMLALGLSSSLSGGVPPAATLVANPPPCGWAAGLACHTAEVAAGMSAPLRLWASPGHLVREQHRPG